jgi:glycosyltransferase involved in cell wall biosynthesis
MSLQRISDIKDNTQRGRQPKIGIFVSFSGEGGVERMILNLCKGLIHYGCQVDLLPVKAHSEHLPGRLPAGLRVHRLGANHTLSSLPALIRYLKTEGPDAILAAKDRANQTAILAKTISGASTRIVVRMGTTVSAALAGKSYFRKLAWYLPMRLLYPMADDIIAVSKGVAIDLAHITGVKHSAMKVVQNPVISNLIFERARESVSHPWLKEPCEPVILAIGRLTRQKDFPTLIRAFSKVKRYLTCRLIILGEGNDRGKIEELARKLSVKTNVDLPGFVDNPYAYLSRASLFVLSSAWEGSPNVLTEALALGVPSVSTDCPSGPKEILQNGIIGKLVPVGNANSMANAILETLSNPPQKALLQKAIQEYTVESSSKRYLDILLNKRTD